MSRMSELAVEIEEIGELFDQLSERIDALPLSSNLRQYVVNMLSRAQDALIDEFDLTSTGDFQ